MNARSEKRIGWRSIGVCVLLITISFLIAGCASPNVDPAKAKSRTGYADFYCETNEPLSWEVAEMDTNGQRARVIYSSFDPLEEKILRLAFEPGRYRLRISFLNQVVLDRGMIEVEIKDGMITPVHVTLAAAGTALVERKERSVGPTFYGRSGRNTAVGSYETQTWRVEAVLSDPLPYRVKDQMPYYAPAAQ
jgi:hypothetical protein